MLSAAYPGNSPSGAPCRGGYCCSAISGIEGLPVMMQTIPLLDGTSLPLTYIPQTGTIGIAIIVARPASNDEDDYYDLLDKVARAFYHRRNEVPAPGTLMIQRPGGATPRQIQVFTTSGLNTPEVGVNNITVFTLALSTPDPYWSDASPTPLHFPGIFGNTGIFPIFPIAFNQTSVLGSMIMTNWGDAATYPDWIITGPGQITVKNNTSNRSWGLNTSIPNGQQVQVTTSRGKQTAVNLSTNPPTNIWNQLVFSGPHDLWPLMVGDNSVTVTISGATATTTVDVGFTNRYTRA
jgi:hypothetical protein